MADDDPYEPLDVGFTSICFGLLLFSLGLLGAFVNINNIMIMLSTKDRHTSYGHLCIVRGFYNITNLSIFILYTGPNTAFQYLPLWDEVGRVICFFVSTIYAAFPLLQLGVTYNRVIALFFPLQYDKLCTVKAAWVFITAGLSYGIYFIIHQLTFGCRFVYNPKMLTWKYRDCPYEDKRYNFIYPILTMTGVVLVLNLTVAFRLMFMKFGETSTGSHEKKNKRMFWQSFVQDLFNANDLVWQCFLSGLVTNSRMWVFFADTLVWELSPICDGLVNLLFDGKLRRLFWSKRKNGFQTTEQPTRSNLKVATSRIH